MKVVRSFLCYPITLLALLAVSASSQNLPASNVVAPSATVAESPAIAKNPTFLFRTLSFSQEGDRLAAGDGTLTTTVGYTEPFRNASMSLGISAPFSRGNRLSGRSVTLSDITIKGQWIPYITPRKGILLTTSLTAPTSRDSHIGDGRWMVAPSGAYARFWGPKLLLAQFVQHQISFARPNERARVNRTDLDLYMVYSGNSLRWWMNADLNLRFDEANDKTPSSATLSIGRGLRKIKGGSLNGSLQLGAGIGRDRPYNAMISGGVTLVGFHRER